MSFRFPGLLLIWQMPNYPDLMYYLDVTLINPKVLIGLFVGGLSAFIFSAMTMKAVGRAARSMVEEVRRQFREIAGIMDGTGKPDYAACVAISTRGAQREMFVPSLLALLVPIVTGFSIGCTWCYRTFSGKFNRGFPVSGLYGKCWWRLGQC